ncbi:MAG: metal-dependent hydrolase [Bdellovibrionaceae bacterium]|nr:metal-dependent hydrolase [Pseudobdellovibrionaceae bacterium]
MATIFSHAVVGCTMVGLPPSKLRAKSIYFFAGLSAILPDFDYLGYVRQIPYSSVWGHRGITHSLLFAAITGIVLGVPHGFWLKASAVRLSVFFFLTTISHGIIDACTNGGLGVAFYAPYNTLRYFFPWRPIQVSPMGLGFFSERGLVVLISELYWILLPCAAIALVRVALNWKRKNQN